MSIRAYLDNFAVSTSAAGTQQARTGYGFAPKAIIVWGFGRTDATSASGAGDMVASFGFATSTSARACITYNDEDDLATADASSARATDAVYGAGTARLDVQSFGSDGVTFVVDVQFSTAHQVFVLALGGNSLTHASVVELSGPAASDANKSHTGIGFQPNCGIFTYLRNASGAGLTIGAAAGENGSIVNKSIFTIADDGGTTNTARTYNTTLCWDSQDVSNAVDGSVQSWDSDGLTMRWDHSAPGQQNMSSDTLNALLLRAVPEGSLTLHEVSTLTNTSSDISITGLSAPPTFGFAVSASVAADSVTSNALVSCGAFAGATNKCHAYYSVDNVGTSDVSTAIDHEDLYRNASGTGAMRVNSTTSSSVVFRMSTADSSSFPVFVLVGAAPELVKGAPIFF